MKKVYLLLTVALISSALVNAQIARSTKNVGKTKTTRNSTVARHSAPSNSNTVSSAVIWSDDFSNAANWSMTNQVGNSDNWVINSIGPIGQVYGIGPINTTGDFALFDSDTLCSHDQIADITTVNPIDLTGHPAVRLSFNEFYKRYHDSTYVFVSTNGTTWTRFEVNAGMQSGYYCGGSALNTPGPNPFPVTLDISSVAGNQATVWIRFEFYSPDTNGAGPDTLQGQIVAGCGFAWMIDDVTISDISNVDAGLIQNDAGEYPVFPIIQPEAMKLRGRLINTGATAFTGGQIIFNVYDLNGWVFSDTSAAAPNLNPGDTSAFLMGALSYTPPATGFYLVEQLTYVSGDGDNTNDTSLVDILVDDSLYTRGGAYLGEGNLLGAYGFINGATGSFGSIYEIWHASDFTSARAFLSGPTVGDHISFEIWSVVGGVPDAVLGTTGSYQLQSQDTGWVTVAFPTPVSVPAGQYCVVINQLDVNNLSLAIGTDAFTAQKSFFRSSAGGNTWTTLEPSLKGVPLIQVNNPSGTLLGTKSLVDNNKINLYPNPSSGYVFITGNHEKNVTVEVTNATGQVVKSVKFEDLTVNHLDLRNSPSGMYNVRITSDAGQVVKTIVIE